MGKKQEMGFSREEVAAASRARDRASRGTPTLVVNAFFPERVMAGELQLLPVTMSVIMALEKMAPGLLHSEDESKFSMREIAGALWVMTQPIEFVRTMIASGQADASVDQLADHVPANLLPTIGKLLNTHLQRAFETAVPHGGKKGGDPSSPFGEARNQAPGSAG